MDTFYYPRLQAAEARRLLNEYTGLTPRQLVTRSEITSERSYWYPTAPQARYVPEGVLDGFRRQMRTIASTEGYPEVLPDRHPGLGRFDRATVHTILDLTRLLPTEAATESVWSFLSLVVAPDIAFWRFPNRKQRDDYERILGYPRNVFRRLWWRAYTLGTSTADPGSRVLEDESVAILERPTVGGNHALARAIASTHIRRFESSPRRTEIMRDATKRIRRLHAFISFNSLSEKDLQAIVDEAFDRAAEHLLPARPAATDSGDTAATRPVAAVFLAPGEA